MSVSAAVYLVAPSGVSVCSTVGVVGTSCIGSTGAPGNMIVYTYLCIIL